MNGLYTDSPEEEAEEIRDNELAATVLMAFNPRDAAGSIDPESRLKLLEEKLLPVARRNGLSNLIIDSIAIDPATISLSAETVYMVKEKYGFPSGCAPANALGPVSKKTVGLEGMYSVHGGVAVYLRVMGSDLIMYGPVQRIKYVAPAVAMADSLLGYSLRHHGVRIRGSHPLRRYLCIDGAPDKGLVGFSRKGFYGESIEYVLHNTIPCNQDYSSIIFPELFSDELSELPAHHV